MKTGGQASSRKSSHQRESISSDNDICAASQPDRSTAVTHLPSVNDDHRTQQPERPKPVFYHYPPAQFSPIQFSPVQSLTCNGALAQSPTDDNTGMSDIAKNLVRRELVNSGLIKFNDRPESYRISSFTNATGGLNLTASEELDLLSKWLGTQSSEYVTRIRSVYVANPELGRRRAWERFEECYSSPEVTKRTLFQRIEHFPKSVRKTL